MLPPIMLLLGAPMLPMLMPPIPMPPMPMPPSCALGSGMGLIGTDAAASGSMAASLDLSNYGVS